MDSSYPRPITNWEGIPNNLDAATTYTNGKTYFFKGDKYYKFDDSKLEVARSAEYPYPRDSGKWWFGVWILLSHLEPDMMREKIRENSFRTYFYNLYL